MATDSTIVYTPENNGGTVPAWMAMNATPYVSGGYYQGNGGYYGPGFGFGFNNGFGF